MIHQSDKWRTCVFNVYQDWWNGEMAFSMSIKNWWIYWCSLLSNPSAPLVGASRLRGIICNPVSSVSCILWTLFPISRLPISVSGSLGSVWSWWCPRAILKSNQISIQSPRQQRSWNSVPRPSEIMQNGGPCNHDQSNFCGSWFLQYFLCKYLIFQLRTSRLRPANHQKKKPGNNHNKLLMFWSKVPN